MSSNKGSKNKPLQPNQIEIGGITKVTRKTGSKIELLHPNAGGIDIGATQIYVCGKDGEFQVFDTFTASCSQKKETQPSWHFCATSKF